MGKKYTVASTVGVTNTDATAMWIWAVSATTIRPRIYDFVLGSKVAPADTASGYRLKRTTNSGTTPTTTYTPRPLDPADPASAATGAGGTFGTSPDHTTTPIDLFTFDLNQRATFRWVAAPGSEFVVPATAGNSIAVVGFTPTTAFACDSTVWWEE